jgi:hypothetical protein
MRCSIAAPVNFLQINETAGQASCKRFGVDGIWGTFLRGVRMLDLSRVAVAEQRVRLMHE